MEIRLEMAKCWVNLYLMKMVTQVIIQKCYWLRKNVLDIIDFKYQHESNQDTEIEEHSYKDYTVTSDFFYWLLYDPILMMEVVDLLYIQNLISKC
jgi:hypothetical protein